MRNYKGVQAIPVPAPSAGGYLGKGPATPGNRLRFWHADLDDERSWNSIAMQEQVLAGAGARPVARIPESPWTAPGPYPTLTLRGWSALEVWRRRCLGPQIEIHRLPRR